MNGKVSIQTVAKRITIVLFVLIAIMIFGKVNSVEASSSPIFEVSKYSYNESKSELIVALKINPNISLKYFQTIITYNQDVLRVMPFVEGNTITNTQDDFRLLSGTTLDNKWHSTYGGGTIDFCFDEELEVGTSKVSAQQNICLIKFKVLGENKVLEEDLKTNWFDVESYAILDGEDNFYDTSDGDSGAIKVNTMPKIVESITAKDVVFDKTEYYDGEKITLVSGTAEINYSNTSGAGVKTVVDLATLQDENGNTININKGPWNAKYGKNYVKLNYKKVESNEIPVTVLDRIEYIKLKDYNSIYEYGDELDKENVKILIKRVSKTNEEEKSLKELEDLGIATILGFNSTMGPKQTIDQMVNLKFDFTEFKYKDELQLNLTIIDTVQKLEWINEPDKKIYKYKEMLNTDNGKIKVVYKSTEYDEVNLNNSMVSEQNGNAFDNTLINTRNLKVTYNYTENKIAKNKTLNYEITINDYIKEITITTPNKVEYMYGEEPLNLDGGKIQIIWAGKEDKGIPPEEKNLSDLPLVNNGSTDNERLEIVGFDSGQEGEEEITLKYYYIENGEAKTKLATYKINIIDPIIDIKLEDEEKEKIKKLYKYGEELNLNDSKLTLIRLSKKEEKINLTKEMVKEYNSQKLGIQNLNIEYKGMKLEREIEIEVKDYIKNIVIVTPKKTEYMYGEEKLNLDGGKIKIIWASKEQNPEEKNLSEIELINKRIISEEKIETIGFNSTKVGRQPITIKYYYTEDGIQKIKEATYTINIIDPIIDIKLEDEEKEKIKKLYKYEEELELNDSKLTVIRLSGAESKINLTKDMIKNYNSQELGIQELDIEYNGKKLEKAVEVEVEDYIKDIVLVKPDKTVYLPGEILDLTGATVRTLSASGILGEVQAVTMEMISGYKEDEMGTQNLTVTYVGFDKDFDVIFTVQTGERKYQRL